MANPSKIVLTSRWHVEADYAVWHFVVPELDFSSAAALIRHEAALRNTAELATADDATVERIYSIVGGNPQALRLVVGQTHVHALDFVLDDLAQLRGAPVENLYTYIYQRIWDSLAIRERQVLLATLLLPPAGGTLDKLTGSCGGDPAVRDIVARLIKYNVVNSSTVQTGERVLTLHGLTRRFLHKQLGQVS